MSLLNYYYNKLLLLSFLKSHHLLSSLLKNRTVTTVCLFYRKDVTYLSDFILQQQQQRMSVFSGFATRQQQHKYNNLVQTLIISLKKRILKFYAGEDCDEDKFKLLTKKIYKKMFMLERGKFMQPKYTSCFTDLIQTLNIQINYDTISECSSISNLTFRKAQDKQQDQLQSRNALVTKMNELEKKEKQKRQLSAPRNSKYLRMTINNQQERQIGGSSIRKDKMASSMFSMPEEVHKKKKKVFGVMVDIKQLRGTVNMPQLQDFVPKRSQIIPLSPPRRSYSPQRSQSPVNSPVRMGNSLLVLGTQKKQFRRQKYVREAVKIEDI